MNVVDKQPRDAHVVEMRIQTVREKLREEINSICVMCLIYTFGGRKIISALLNTYAYAACFINTKGVHVAGLNQPRVFLHGIHVLFGRHISPSVNRIIPMQPRWFDIIFATN